MNSTLLLARHHLRDQIQNSDGLRGAIAIAKWASSLAASGPKRQSLRIQAFQKAETDSLIRWVHPGEGAIHDWGALQLTDASMQEALARYDRALASQSTLTRSIILKPPAANGEKGVLLMYFEYNWARLLKGIDDLSRFTEDYNLILSSSWSPTDYSLLAAILARVPGRIYVQACNYGEIPKLLAFNPRILCLDSLPCDWIDPAAYQPRAFNDREFDFVMVANWAPFKRHYEFFAALSRMPAHLKIALVGQKEGGFTQDYIRNLARQLGVKQELIMFESIPSSKVAELQCNSKAAIIFSRREGCCVSAVEALFAGAPLGMRADAHVGPLAYINDRTGMRFANDRPLDQQLMTLLERAPNLDPRKWAVENVSCATTHAKLNAQLKRHEVEEGRPWTTDLVLPCWRPYPMYLHQADRERLRPVYEGLATRHPRVFADNLIEVTHR